jgi:NAD(P)-dependent dehydrogenase (short-subunit alcohol dehydrogenase family)
LEQTNTVPRTKQNIVKRSFAAIFVTGCDSGFGKEIVLWAANASFVVFAGCLKREFLNYYNDEKTTSSSSTSSSTLRRVIPIIMNVTKDEDVARVASQVSAWIEEERDGDTTTNTKK